MNPDTSKIQGTTTTQQSYIEWGLYLVSIFKFSVIGTSGLYCVIGQVNQSILNVFYVVLATGRPQVALSVEIGLKISIHRRGQRKESNVELPELVKHWPFAVLLNYVRTLLAIDHVVADDGLYLGQVSAHGYPAPSVRILAWLHDPEVLAHGRVFDQIGMLAWVVVRLLKLVELMIQQTFLDVVCQGQIVKSRLGGRLVVHAHIVVDRFLVREVKIVFLVIRGPQRVTRVVFRGGVHHSRLFVIPAQGCDPARKGFQLNYWLLLILTRTRFFGNRVLGQQFALGRRDEVFSGAAALLVSDVGRRHTVLGLLCVLFIGSLTLFERLQSLDDTVVLPLGPGEVVVAVVVKVAHRPPKPLLETRADGLGVISLPEEILVGGKRSYRKTGCVSV